VAHEARFVWRFSFLDATWTLLSHTGTIQEVRCCQRRGRRRTGAGGARL